MTKFSNLFLLTGLLYLLAFSGVEGWWRRRRRGYPPAVTYVPAPTKPCGGDLTKGLQNARVLQPYTPNRNQNHGSSVQFACNSDGPVLYTHDSGHATRVCFNGKWSGSPMVCKNVDECQEGNNRCHDRNHCHDTDGSYTCSCPDGWVLQADRHTCVAPGCGALNGIEHGSVLGAPRGTADHNLRVFFQCDYGYELHGSTVSTCKAGSWDYPDGPPVCRDKNECSLPTHGCSQICDNTDGSYKCDCREGYGLEGDGITCKPLCTGDNECLQGECVAPETCDCVQGWTGAACDEAICDPPCDKGRCVYPQVCVCVRGWTGPTCSHGMCWGGCRNGGTCTGPLKCDCLEGFDGDRCEISSCEDLAPPDNGLIACLTFNKQRVCTIYCQDGHGFAAPVDNPYACGEDGYWSNELSRESVPDCSPVDPMGIIAILETEYEFEGECSGLTSQEKEEIRQRTLQIVRARICSGGCPSVEISAPEEPECGEIVDDPDPFGFGLGKRQATVTSRVSVKYVIEATPLGNETTAKHCTSECKAAVYAAARDVYTVAQKAKGDLERAPIALTVGDVAFQLVKDSVQASRPTSRCANEGEVRIGTRCMKCPRGSFLQESKCLLCSVGTYQDEVSQSSCKPCPNGTTTFAAGSRSKAHCVTNCTRGTYSRTGMGPCNKCPLNTYQDVEGQTRCKKCPNGTATFSAGAANRSHCLDGCKREECGVGFLCDECKCINDQNVCDLTMDCEDGSDESNCMKDDGFCEDLEPCRSDFLNIALLCMADVVMWARIDEIDDGGSGNRTLSVLKADLYHNRRPLDQNNVVQAKLRFGTKAISCGCPVLEVGKIYVLTVNRNLAQEEIVSHRSMTVEWNAKVKTDLHKTMRLLDDKRCEKLLDSPEEEE